MTTTINDIYMGFPVEIEAAHFDSSTATSQPLTDIEPIYLTEEHSQEFIAQILHNPKAVSYIESTLQGLCQRTDGVRLITTFGSPEDFIEIFKKFEYPIHNLYKTIELWESREVNEIYIHFVDKRQYH